MKGDVYPVEPSDVSSFNQVLDAHWGVLFDEDVRIIITTLNLCILHFYAIFFRLYETWLSQFHSHIIMVHVVDDFRFCI